MPNIEKIKGVPEYEFEQSKCYPERPRFPMWTCLVSGAGGGKTTTILAMCLQIYGFEVFEVVSSFWAVSSSVVLLTVVSVSAGFSVLSAVPCHGHSWRSAWICHRCLERVGAGGAHCMGQGRFATLAG